MENERIIISVIIPAFNEVDNIGECIERLLIEISKITHEYEVIIVNDGSTDETGKLITIISKKNKKIRTTGYEKNKGKGFAVRYGIKKAKGKYIVLMDADLDIHPRQIKGYLLRLIKKHKNTSIVGDIGQYFAFFQNPFGKVSSFVNERMLLTPGVLLMVTLLAGVYICFKRESTKEIYFYLILSALFLFVASDLFPWNTFESHTRIGKTFAEVNLTWRYLSIAVVFLSLLFGNILEWADKHTCGLKKTSLIVWAICIVMTGYFTSSYYDGVHLIKNKDTADMDHYFLGGKEYLLKGVDVKRISEQKTELVTDNLAHASITSRKGTSFEIDCSSGGTPGTVEIPAFNYKGYEAVTETGEKLQIMDGKNRVVKVIIPKDYSGKIMVNYVEPMSWKTAEIVSLITIGVVVYGCIYFKKSRKGKKE